MKTRKVVVDLPSRREQRFILPNSSKFISEMLRSSDEVRFSSNGCVQTIYLDNDASEVTLSSTIKARTYLPDLKKDPTLNDSEYFIEVKTRTGRDLYRKERTVMRLDDAVKTFGGAFSSIRPFVAVEYSRRHFRPKGYPNVRVTVDTDLRYFYIDNGRFVSIGNEDYDRIEVKSANEAEAPKLIDRLLADSGAIPTISKQSTAFNFLGLFFTSKYGSRVYKELRGVEIESKLELTGQDFSELSIKNLFRNGGIPGFILPAHFPYETVTRRLNRYYQDGTGGFKLMLIGTLGRVIRKGSPEIVQNPYNLSCILRRKEDKGPLAPLASLLLRDAALVGELFRERRAFWVDNPKTGRIFHFTTDRCTSDRGSLQQVEIEFVGNYNDVKATDSSEKEIIRDISFLTKSVLDKLPQLKPSILTKEDWLRSETGLFMPSLS